MRMLIPLPKFRVFSFLLLVAGAGCGAYPVSKEALAQLLPSGVEMDTGVETWDDSKQTVADELTRVQARVGADGKLQDNTGKPIEFFHRATRREVAPENYWQHKDDETRQLEELRKTHTVIITIPDYPGGIPIP
jgi:hypothetical protein